MVVALPCTAIEVGLQMGQSQDPQGEHATPTRSEYAD
jgi:hypothetical protein